MAKGNFRKTLLGRGPVNACFQATPNISAANDKLLALELNNGMGDTNLILVLQVKYYNFWEKKSL